MVHESADLDMSRTNLVNDTIPSLPASLHDKGLVLDLAGVQGYVAAAAHADPLRNRAIATFWRIFFETTSAEVKNYGAVLLRLP
jgi:hypothetical protein